MNRRSNLYDWDYVSDRAARPRPESSRLSLAVACLVVLFLAVVFSV